MMRPSARSPALVLDAGDHAIAVQRFLDVGRRDVEVAAGAIRRRAMTNP